MTLEEYCIQNEKLWLLQEWDCEENILKPNQVNVNSNKKYQWKLEYTNPINGKEIIWKETIAERDKRKNCRLLKGRLCIIFYKIIGLFIKEVKNINLLKFIVNFIITIYERMDKNIYSKIKYIAKNKLEIFKTILFNILGIAGFFLVECLDKIDSDSFLLEKGLPVFFAIALLIVTNRIFLKSLSIISSLYLGLFIGYLQEMAYIFLKLKRPIRNALGIIILIIAVNFIIIWLDPDK